VGIEARNTAKHPTVRREALVTKAPQAAMSGLLRLRSPGRGSQDTCPGCPSSQKFAQRQKGTCARPSSEGSPIGSPQWSPVHSYLLIQTQDQLLYKELYKYFLNEWRKKVQEAWFQVFK